MEIQKNEIQDTMNKQQERDTETRPDTRQSSRRQLGRSCNAETARNSKMLRTDRPTRQGVELRVHDYKLQKIKKHGGTAGNE